MFVKKLSLVVPLLFLSISSVVYSFESTINAEEKAIYNARLIPAPTQVEFGKGIVAFNEQLKVVLILPQKELEQISKENVSATFQTILKDVFKVKVVPQVLSFDEATGTTFPDEVAGSINELTSDQDFFQKSETVKIIALSDPAVKLDASIEELVSCKETSAGTIVIVASDVMAIHNSFKTLQQLSETFGDVETIEKSRYFIPEIRLTDSPAMKFRGIHLCWFPETSPERIEQSIRIAAYYKFNYAVVEFWGVFPFESCSDLYWQNFHTTKEEVRRLVQLGKSLGINLIPQMNLFGHATSARVSVGKHATLDFRPEMEPLFEPDGWTWNIYNPATRALLSKCVLELYETFDQPEFFHIGCDEAYSAGTGIIARRKGNYVDQLADWLNYFHDLLKEKNCRLLMWHDMLIGYDPAFSGYVVSGNAKTKGLLDKLPRDIVVCDWQYGKPKEKETWPTTKYFLSQGFDVLVCPWRDVNGIKSLAKTAAQDSALGILCTTWHMFYGDDMRNILVVGSQSAWGTIYQGSGSDKLQQFNRHLRQATINVSNKKYQTGGVNDWQVLKETNGPLG